MALSKTKLQSYAQCPRRVWLETYNPELEEASAQKSMRLDAGRTVDTIARQLYGRGGGHTVSFDRGLRAAIDTTRSLLAAGGTAPIFEATFDHEGVSVRVDVLDRSAAEELYEPHERQRVLATVVEQRAREGAQLGADLRRATRR